MKRYNFAKLHKKLWQEKAEFAEGVTHRLLYTIPTVENGCFACEATSVIMGEYNFPTNCYACPLDWPNPKPPTEITPRRNGYCHQLFLDYFYSSLEDTKKAAEKAAEKIANIPWRGPRYFVFDGAKWRLWSSKGGSK